QALLRVSQCVVPPGCGAGSLRAAFGETRSQVHVLSPRPSEPREHGMQPGTGSPWGRAVLVWGHVVTPIGEGGPARLRPTATAAAPEARNGCFVNTSSHNLRGHTLPISV